MLAGDELVGINVISIDRVKHSVFSPLGLRNQDSNLEIPSPEGVIIQIHDGSHDIPAKKRQRTSVSSVICHPQFKINTRGRKR
jgi:hypothetical protein